MSKGRYAKKKDNRFALIAVVLTFIILTLAVVIYLGKDTNQLPTETGSTSCSEAETIVITEEQNAESIAHSTAASESEENTETTGPDATQTPTETQPQQSIIPQPTIEVIQQADAEYEKWLAATMVVSLSMEYPDFEIETIYAASATELEDKFSSEGVYIVFYTGGRKITVHSKALEAERTARGTMDISAEGIGYATFDRIDPSTVDFSSMEQIAMEELGELIAQSLLVSVYTR